MGSGREDGIVNTVVNNGEEGRTVGTSCPSHARQGRKEPESNFWKFVRGSGTVDVVAANFNSKASYSQSNCSSTKKVNGI